MKLPEKRPDFSSFFQEETFVIQTCQQISKDLTGLFRSDVEFDILMDEVPLDQLTDQLAVILQKMDASNLQQFIYRVDLKESVFHSALADQHKFHTLAFAVIRREAQKVYLRARFS